MLDRVYVDNYRCFVNFDLKLQANQLVLGLNGSGKSSLLDALRGIRCLMAGEGNPDSLFPENSRTRWETRPEQTFHLHVNIGGVSYQLQLKLDVWGRPGRTRIRREVVLCDGRPVFEFVDGEVHLFNDDFQLKVKYPFDWFRSALATIQRRPENGRLMAFKDWLTDSLHCLEIDPHRITSTTDVEESRPADNLSNFAAWYRHLAQERVDGVAALQDDLRKVLPQFESLDLRSVGGVSRSLVAKFHAPGGDSRGSFQLGLDELSEGQRVLICLYTVLEFLTGDSTCLFLDEPENFLALPEIQPWLMELQDRISDRGGQVILISHHPEAINYLATEFGVILERDGAGPVRTRPHAAGNREVLGMSPADLMARGWTE